LIFGKIGGTKVVISPQSPLHKGTHSAIQEAFMKIYDNLAIPVLFRFYDAIFPHHEAEKEYLIAHGALAYKTFVVNLGVGKGAFLQRKKGFFKKIRTENKKILLFVGRLGNMKGLEVLLKAFAKATRKKKDWLLVLLGPDGGELSKLKKMKAQLHLENMYFWGPVSEENVEEACADADLFILPSQYEPYGLVLLKAMAKGVPCIAVNTGGPTEIIKDGETGLLCEYDAQSMAKVLGKLFHDEKLRCKMGIKAKERAELFSVKRMVDEYEKHYEHILKGS
jgi:glycosyltransferase involved in cell wall biosynthesis